MRIEIGGRQTGRTFRQVVVLTMNPDAVLLAHSSQEKNRILKEYFSHLNRDEFVLLEQRIVTPYTMDSLRVRGRNTIINIDNLDLVLPQLVGNRVGYVTTTKVLETD